LLLAVHKNESNIASSAKSADFEREKMNKGKKKEMGYEERNDRRDR
jgi:hypothetical protein